MTAYSFTDSNGTKYEIRITFRTIFQVADRTGWDLLNPNQTEDGLDLEDRLLTKPDVVTRIVAALCGIDDLDAFFDAIDGKAYKELEQAFWGAYLDFFDQGGRSYIATALRTDLKTRTEAEKMAEENLLELAKKNFSNSSHSQDSPTGKTERSGKSTSSPKPISNSTSPVAPKSSAQSTTLTPQGDKTLNVQSTSTRSKKQEQKKKRKGS